MPLDINSGIQLIKLANARGSFRSSFVQNLESFAL
jgi:hypothetical protein